MRKKSARKIQRPSIRPNRDAGKTASPRVREPIGRSFGLVRGKFPSRKMGRMIHWESQLERDAVLLLEFSSGIAKFREQPIRTYYSFDGKTRRYTPDFELTFHSGEIQFIEVKPLQKSLDPTESHRLTKIREHFENSGRTFRIITETEIRKAQLLENLRVLFRYRHAALDAFDRRKWRERFKEVGAISFDEAAVTVGGNIEVWNLIDQGILACDLRSPINGETVLKVTKEGEKNAECYI
jgi:hypothetical protein